MRANVLDTAFAQAERGFLRVEKNGLAMVYARRLKEAGALHGFTTRRGGVSEGLCASLNLGWNRPEPKENIAENFRRMSDAAGFPYESIALANYQHGDGVEAVTDMERGFGMYPGGRKFAPCDALVSRDRAVTLLTLHADCMPVFLFDPAIRAGGMVHAGWKGTYARIGAKAVKKMVTDLGAVAGRMLAAVGPSISAEYFEVDAPVRDLFAREFADVNGIEYRKQTGKYHVDLPKMMFAQLLEAGVLPENVILSGICTYAWCDDYFSFRRDGPGTGAMAGFIRVC